MRKPSDVLYDFPEWQNDWQSHALFCAYDQDSSEDFILNFWKRAILRIFEESISGLTIDIEELKLMVHRNGRYPTGLLDIISELSKRGDLLSLESLNQSLQDKQDSQYWGYWLKKTFKTFQKTEKIPTRIASPSKLKFFTEKLKTFCHRSERFVFTKTELSQHLKLSALDTNVLINYMKLEGSALDFTDQREKASVELVKIKENSENDLKIKPEDSAIVSLNLTLADIDVKLKELNTSITEIHQQILSELKKQNRINAKHLLMRKKMVTQKVEQLLGARFNIEQQLLSLKHSLTNKEIITTLKSTNKILQEVSPNLEEVTKVLDQSKMNLEIAAEVGETVSMSYGEDNEEELLNEFENLGLEELPTVPKYKLPSRPIEDLEDEFDKLDVGQMLNS